MSKTIEDKQFEAEYKRQWIEDNKGADELRFDQKTEQPVSATYFYPPYHHDQEIKSIFRTIDQIQSTIKKKEEVPND